jgi:hypothetical protein
MAALASASASQSLPAEPAEASAVEGGSAASDFLSPIRVRERTEEDDGCPWILLDDGSGAERAVWLNPTTLQKTRKRPPTYHDALWSDGTRAFTWMGRCAHTRKLEQRGPILLSARAGAYSAWATGARHR